MHRFGYSPRRIAILALTSLAAMAGAESNASAAQAATMRQGTCPVGYLCLYKSGSWNNAKAPDAKYYRCGVVNLSGWVGRGRVVNNQTGRVTTRFYTEFGGKGKILAQLSAHARLADFDFYPVNSIRVC